ncbi:myosin-binding protein 7-like [Arachis stenosperma]|uniref:myosin-binding protein 7-like n=1 Tax=Arachis stenosperma TaxID=217475 RepID=UPI0025ABB87E|nr:myosin-binding protein 7-like [Arachis stenosperma]XP_057731179.1 myosin-binding protein 7-like [Arachis stenosperma]XP_057731188.1 myosin-binding protein 7-like [Arachis stenosperma]
MVETSTASPMAEADITAMKETLRAQQILLQQLHAELDQEREASATAASEAMDMILRLQGEKAAVKMEASHYKRMAEEKIGHAEETLEVFEELMYQKEMETTALEFQVLAYKQKLLALGVDINLSELEFPDDLLLNRSEQNGDDDQSSSMRRLQSLPPIAFKNTFRAARKRDRSPSPTPFNIPVPKSAENNDQEDYPNGSLDSYWNQIKKLDEKVKEISDCKESGVEICPRPRIRRGRSCSLLSQLGSPATSDQTDKVISSRASRHGSTNDRESVASVSTLVNVHDVFEVPQASEKKVLEADSRLTKPDSLSDEIVESNVRPDIDKRKSKIIPQKPISKDMKTIIRQKKEEMDAESNASRAEIQRLHQRIERLERERMNPRPHEGDKEEHLRLLKEIYHRITLIMSEIKSIKTETPPPKNVPLDPLQEAMLYFWI